MDRAVCPFDGRGTSVSHVKHRASETLLKGTSGVRGTGEYKKGITVRIDHSRKEGSREPVRRSTSLLPFVDLWKEWVWVTDHEEVRAWENQGGAECGVSGILTVSENKPRGSRHSTGSSDTTRWVGHTVLVPLIHKRGQSLRTNTVSSFTDFRVTKVKTEQLNYPMRCGLSSRVDSTRGLFVWWNGTSHWLSLRNLPVVKSLGVTQGLTNGVLVDHVNIYLIL